MDIIEGRYTLVRTYFRPDQVIMRFDCRDSAIDQACSLCYQKCVDEMYIIDTKPHPKRPEIIRVDREGNATVVKTAKLNEPLNANGIL
jgi:hypothetical protein